VSKRISYAPPGDGAAPPPPKALCSGAFVRITLPRGSPLRACTWPPQSPAYSSVGEERRTPDRTDELIAELRDRVRSLEEANRENRRIIASLTSRAPEQPAPPEAIRTEPVRRRYSSWWKERFGAAMVGVMTAFAVLASSGEENPFRVAELGREQASVPTTPANTEPAPAASEPVPVSEPAPAPAEPAPEPVPGEPAPEPAPSQEPAPTDPVR
jgi:hypothetical protein